MEKKPNCRQCKHFHISWDPHAPHGCKAYGIKSKAMPTDIVKQASQTECLKFEPKIKKKSLSDKSLW